MPPSRRLLFTAPPSAPSPLRSDADHSDSGATPAPLPASLHEGLVLLLHGRAPLPFSAFFPTSGDHPPSFPPPAAELRLLPSPFSGELPAPLPRPVPASPATSPSPCSAIIAIAAHEAKKSLRLPPLRRRPRLPPASSASMAAASSFHSLDGSEAPSAAARRLRLQQQQPLSACSHSRFHRTHLLRRCFKISEHRRPAPAPPQFSADGHLPFLRSRVAMTIRRLPSSADCRFRPLPHFSFISVLNVHQYLHQISHKTPLPPPSSLTLPQPPLFPAAHGQLNPNSTRSPS